jgi:FkbM family methyltransferase
MAFQTYVEVWLDRVYHQGVVQVQPGDVVVDVGANYGFFSLFAWAQEASRVVAVEPFPPTYECLRQNTQKFSNIQTLPVAVGAKSESGTMYPSRVSGSNFLIQNESWVEGSENIKPVNATGFEVQILTWPEILEQGQITKIDFLKVDCEGGEVDLFQNMEAQHWDMLSKIAVEFHSSTGKEIILDLLSAHKFQIQSCSDGEIGLILAHSIKP